MVDIIIDVGLELEGVPVGVLFGVEEALPTLALLGPDLGVTFGLSTGFAAVGVFCFGVDRGLRLGNRTSRPRSGVDFVNAVSAKRGVT